MKRGWKTFIRCYTIALKFWDEFNANFVLLYFQVIGQWKRDTFNSKNANKKATRQCIKTPKQPQY